MLAAIAIPGQLATARLAGMPPETGLYAFAAGSLAFAAFGANRFMSVAADSTIAPIFAGGLASMAAAGAAALCRAGRAAGPHGRDHSLVAGRLAPGRLARRRCCRSRSRPASSPASPSTSSSASCRPCSACPTSRDMCCVRLVRHPRPRRGGQSLYARARRRRPGRHPGHGADQLQVPGALIGSGRRGPGRRAVPSRPAASSCSAPCPLRCRALAAAVLPGIADLGHLVPLALVVAMVCIMQTAAVAGTFPSETGQPDDVSRDFAGVGAGSIVAGLIGSFAVDSSPPSTAIVVESGGRSQIASLTAVGLMIALAVLAAGLMAYVPHAALSGILVYIALRIFRLDEMIRIYRHGGCEILLVAASGGLVVALPIEAGMLLAIVLSFVHSLYAVARPYCAELARVPGSTVWWPPSRGREGRACAGRPRLRAGGTAQLHQCRVHQRQDHDSDRRRAGAGEAAGDRGERHHRHRLYRLANPAADHCRAAVALHRGRDRPAVGPTRPGRGRPNRADRGAGPERVFKSVEEAVRRIGPHA